MQKLNFHDQLKKFMKEYVHGVYDITEKFPKNEIFGSTSQIRRASLSILLNYTEGFARQRSAVMKNFYEISYGSLKESMILLEFSYERKYVPKTDFERLYNIGDQIGKMLWSILLKI
ncbi:MAG TPA: four helix bundle protein [Candidatus Paceibacterota bacterium]